MQLRRIDCPLQETVNAMNLIPRGCLAAAPVAIAVTLSVALGTSAQVATLGSPDETPAPQDASPAVEFADREEALLAFTQCLRDNGIDVDDPVAGAGGGGGVLRGGPAQDGEIDPFGDAFQAAQAACGTILEAARPEVDPAAQQERLEDVLLLAQCLRENGYAGYPDPALDDDGRLERDGLLLQELGIDRRSEAFQTARSQCAHEAGVEAFEPGGGPGGRGGT